MNSKKEPPFYIDLDKAIICKDEELRQYLLEHISDLLNDYFTKKNKLRHYYLTDDEISCIKRIYRYSLPDTPYCLTTKKRNRYDVLKHISIEEFIECFEYANFKKVINNKGRTPYFVYGIIYYFYSQVCGERFNLRTIWYDSVSTILNISKDKIRNKGHDYYQELCQNM